MNVFRQWLCNRSLKKALAANRCRLDSGIKGLRGAVQLTLEYGARLHQVKIVSRQLSVGAYTDIVSGVQLREVSSIGRYCSIGSNVTIGQDRNSHPLNWVSSNCELVSMRQRAAALGPHHEGVQPVVIGHDVWIGMDVLVLDGVSIGTGAVIGAQSLVTRDIPPYAIALGSPAQVVRYRFDEVTVEALLASQWWNLPAERLAQLPLEDPQAMLEQLHGVAAADCRPAQVVVDSKPFAIRHVAAP